jgi:hypothetical protein
MGLKSPVSGYPNSVHAVSSCLVSVNDPAAGKLRARRTRPLATNQPMPAPGGRASANSEVWFT